MLLSVLTPALLLPAPSGQLFVDVAAQRGFGADPASPGMSAGLSAADFDGDGDIDLFVPCRAGTPDRLYVNNGAGHFAESAAAAGLADLAPSRAALWFDANGDGRLDLLVAGDCFGDEPCGPESSLRLYIQRPDATFANVTATSGVACDLDTFTDTHTGGLAAGDLDGDGDLDLVVSYWEGSQLRLLNDGSGRFALRRNFSDGQDATAPYWQPVIHDFDGDGRMDVFQAVDFYDNQLWRGTGGGGFDDVAALAGVDNAFNEMGVALGDPDRDGDLDIYVTNLFNTLAQRHNTLFERSGAGLVFSEVSRPAGVDNTGCGWGASFGDVDLDGRPDLVAVGTCSESDPELFWNDTPGGLHLLRTEGRSGIEGARASGLAQFDMDGDGDLDLALRTDSGVRLLLNRMVPLPERSSITIRLRQPGPNARAYGATVWVTDATGARTASAILAGSSLLSQEPAEAHFGVPAGQPVDIEIRWPDGTLQSIPTAPVGAPLEIHRTP